MRGSIRSIGVWTIGKTAERNGRNPHRLFEDYLETCATAGGQVPANWRGFLPCPPPSTLAAQPVDGAPAPPAEQDSPEDAAAEDPGQGVPEPEDAPPSAPEGPEDAAAEDPGRGAPEAEDTSAPTEVPVAADAPQAAQDPAGFGAGLRPAPEIGPSPAISGTPPPVIAWPPDGQSIASTDPPDSRAPGRRRHGARPRTAARAARRGRPGGRDPARTSARPP